jgi:hypothetical protein
MGSCLCPDNDRREFLSENSARNLVRCTDFPSRLVPLRLRDLCVLKIQLRRCPVFYFPNSITSAEITEIITKSTLTP